MLASGLQSESGKEKTVLVLVVASDLEPWRSIEILGQRTTWATPTQKAATVLFYYGKTHGIEYWMAAAISKFLHIAGQDRLRRTFLRACGTRYKLRTSEFGDRLEVDIPGIQGNIGAKTIGAFRHVLRDRAFDYIFRTNTSSYVCLPQLRNFVQTIPAMKYYGGVVGQTLGLPFVSGAGILLSRDLVETATRDSDWDWDLMDDQALASCMARAGVSPQNVERIEVSTQEQVALIPPSQWRNRFHVRCKSNCNRLCDIDIMKCVHTAYRTAWPDLDLR